MAPPYRTLVKGENPNRLAAQVVMVKLGDEYPWPARIAAHHSDQLVTNADGTDYDLVEAVTVWGGPNGAESWRTVPVSCLSSPTAAQRRKHGAVRSEATV